METSIMPKIVAVQFEGEFMIIRSAQSLYKWKVAEISRKLYNATEAERNNFQISPSGYGIHWPQIDEDLSINGLLHSQI